MKKTHSTNIGGRIFAVEEDAYRELTAYIASLSVRFQSYPDAKDILADIEARIADHLLATAGAPHIVTSDDVARVVAAMGRADQFGDTGEVPAASRAAQAAHAHATHADTGSPNAGASTQGGYVGGVAPGAAPGIAPGVAPGIARPRLFRDPDEHVIAGVASGIAAYFGVSPTWIRLSFLASLLLGGTGLLLYLVLWVSVPKARTLTDRMRMRGEHVTLAAIDQGLRDESGTATPRWSHTTRTIFRILIAGVVILMLLMMGMCIGVLHSEGGTRTYKWHYHKSIGDARADSSMTE